MTPDRRMKLQQKGAGMIKLIFCACMLLVFLNGCSSLKMMKIEIAVQPEQPIADDIQSLVLLNRSMTSKFSNMSTDSLEKIFYREKMSIDEIFYDSIAADTLIQTAAKALFESGRFEVVVPKQKNMLRPDNEIAKPLNNLFIRELCRDFKVDGVLVLENYREHLQRKNILSNSFETSNGSIIYIGTTTLLNWPEWCLYTPDEHRKAIRIEFCEPIFRKDKDANIATLYAKMPKTKAYLISGGINTGYRTAAMICPGWNKQNRNYYLTGKREIDVAKKLIAANKWEEAAVIWRKFADAKSIVLRSKIEFNLALAAEMSGNLSLAVEWANKSSKTRPSKAAGYYLEILNEQIKLQQKKNKQ